MSNEISLEQGSRIILETKNSHMGILKCLFNAENEKTPKLLRFRDIIKETNLADSTLKYTLNKLQKVGVVKKIYCDDKPYYMLGKLGVRLIEDSNIERVISAYELKRLGGIV